MKKIVLAIILTAIICIGGTVYAVTIVGRDISYDNTNSGLTSTNVQDAVDELTNLAASKKIDLLWTNQNPTSAFAAQTINIDLSDYDAIVLKANSYTGVSFNFPDYLNNQTIIEKGSSGNVIFGGWGNGSVDNCWFAYRTVTVSDSGVTFGAGSYWYAKSNRTDNTYAIPIKIYGVKGTLQEASN